MIIESLDFALKGFAGCFFTFFNFPAVVGEVLTEVLHQLLHVPKWPLQVY